MTYTLPVFDTKGKEVDKVKLSGEIFDDSLINESLIQQYVVAHLANQRYAIAHTKTRGEVKRSGRKLYKQKGTGRARVGDAGSPIRRKGGTVFGPRKEANYSLAMPKKMKRGALIGALSLKARDAEMVGLKELGLSEIKTKLAASTIQSLGLGEKKILVVLPENDTVAVKSLRNIENVSVVSVRQVNAYELLSHRHVVMVGNSVQLLEDHLLA